MTQTEVDRGTMTTLVVGGQHYSARLSAGESARLIREPDNPHDPNAIRVDNIAGEKAGHLPREVAAALGRRLSAMATSGSWATPRLRRAKLEGVISSRERTGRPRSDQGRVWDEVTGSLSRLHVHSPTTSLSSAYEARVAKMAEYGERVRLPDDACGVVAALGDRILGIELFGAPSTLSGVWPRLSEGYFLEAIEETKAAAHGGFTADLAGAFIRTMTTGLRAAPKQPALGIEL